MQKSYWSSYRDADDVSVGELAEQTRGSSLLTQSFIHKINTRKCLLLWIDEIASYCEKLANLIVPISDQQFW